MTAQTHLLHPADPPACGIENPQGTSAILFVSVVPANVDLGPKAVLARQHAILRPYQDQIEPALNRRAAASQPTALFAMHSCTDRLRRDPGPRPWQISVIVGRDGRLGTALVEVLPAQT